MFIEKSINVKLNNEIPVKHTLTFRNWSSIGSSEELIFSVGGFAYLPKGLAKGIYEVDVIIDGIGFRADTKIKVLENRWSLYGTSFPGSSLSEYANFIINDNLFLIEADRIWQPRSPKVWKFDLKSKNWSQKSNFPVPVNESREISGITLQSNTNGYVVLSNSVRNDSIELWKYNHELDTWSYVTVYPGKGLDVICFFIGDNLYTGCGRRRIDDNIIEYDDFWSYNLSSGLWKMLKNSPVKFNTLYDATCTGGNLGYIYQSRKKALWKYEPGTDNWVIISQFIGLIRINTNLVYLNNKIYLLAGEYMDVWAQNRNDCWSYSLDTKTWEINSFIPTYATRGVSCLYNNKILTGLGKSSIGLFNNKEPNIYSLDE